MGKDKTLSDRMKEYEGCYGYKVPNRSYVIVRLDGVGFSKYTKQFEKPFDDTLSNTMDFATMELCKQFNPKMAYTQSDEISLIFTNLDNINSELIYDGKVQKICSITAARATEAFNSFMLRFLATFRYTPEELVKQITTGTVKELGAIFDARVFVIPDITEVYNYFVWRQQDCTRNSVSMAASANFSHKLLEGKSGSDKQEMLFTEKGINWNDYKPKYKRGVVVKKQAIWVEGENGELVQRNKWIPDYDTPEFSKDREYLQNLIPVSK